jgi:hypothetical protein
LVAIGTFGSVDIGIAVGASPLWISAHADRETGGRGFKEGRILLSLLFRSTAIEVSAFITIHILVARMVFWENLTVLGEAAILSRGKVKGINRGVIKARTSGFKQGKRIWVALDSSRAGSRGCRHIKCVVNALEVTTGSLAFGVNALEVTTGSLAFGVVRKDRAMRRRAASTRRRRSRRSIASRRRSNQSGYNEGEVKELHVVVIVVIVVDDGVAVAVFDFMCSGPCKVCEVVIRAATSAFVPPTFAFVYSWECECHDSALASEPSLLFSLY